MTQFYVLAGNHAQFLRYQKDSRMPTATYISSHWDLRGLRPCTVFPQSFLDRLLNRPVIVTTPLQVIPYGTWYARPDIKLIKEELKHLGIAL